MRARSWIPVLSVVAAVTLGVGLPVAAVLERHGTEVVRGRVVDVDPNGRSLVVVEDAGDAAGATVVVTLRPGQWVASATGEVGLGGVVPGDRVSARVERQGAHEARWVRVNP